MRPSALLRSFGVAPSLRTNLRLRKYSSGISSDDDLDRGGKVNSRNFCLLLAAYGNLSGRTYAIFERRRPSAGLPSSTKFCALGKFARLDASFQLPEDLTQ